MPQGLGRGGGGSGFSLGPIQNEFADNAARNTYATANATWLGEYNGNRTFWIRVGGATGNIQRRNVAGTAWENVTGIVSGPPGSSGLPGGSEAQNQLRFVNGLWRASSVVQTFYVAMTRADTFAALQEAVLLNGTSGITRLETINAYFGASRGNNLGIYNLRGNGSEVDLDNVWPENEDGPFCWLLSPLFYDWIGQFTINVGGNSRTADGTATRQRVEGIAIPAKAWTALLDGVEYQVASIQIGDSITRPVSLEPAPISAGRFGFAWNPVYTPIPDTARTFTQVISP